MTGNGQGEAAVWATRPRLSWHGMHKLKMIMEREKGVTESTTNYNNSR